MRNNQGNTVFTLTLKSVIRAFLLLLPVFLVSPIQASKPISYEGQTNGRSLTVCNKVQGCAVYNLEVYGKLWSLVGEPVYNCAARWSLNYVELWGDGKKKSGTYHKKDVPEKVWRNINLYNVKVALPFMSPNNRGSNDSFDMHCDVGVLYESGSKKPSFSTPTSPSWDRLFIDKRYMKGDDFNYYSEKDAKAFFKSPETDMWRTSKGKMLQQLIGDDIIEASINLNSIRSWHDAKQAKQLEKQLVKTRAKYSETGDDFDSFFEGIDQEKSIKSSLSKKKVSSYKSNNEERRIRYELERRQKNLKASICEEGSLHKLAKAQSLKVASTIIFNDYNKCNSDTDKLIAVQDNHRPYKYGYQDESNNWVIKPKYEEAGLFDKKNKATVILELSSKGSCSDRIEIYTWAIINRKGAIIEGPKKDTRSAPELCLYRK